MIGHHSCSHRGQDALHGPGKRVINLCGGKHDGLGRCTVCGVTQSLLDFQTRSTIPGMFAGRSRSAQKRRTAKQVRSLSKKGK
jgi:hypothetical protein